MADSVETRLAALEREWETMLAVHAGITAIITSLIAKHPDHDQFQLHLAGILEVMAGPTMPLNARQREVVRTYVEQLQQIRAAPGEIDPLRMLRPSTPP